MGVSLSLHAPERQAFGCVPLWTSGLAGYLLSGPLHQACLMHSQFPLESPWVSEPMPLLSRSSNQSPRSEGPRKSRQGFHGIPGPSKQPA